MPRVIRTYQQHKADWSNCTLCPLHQRRQHVVLLRGTIPCKVLLIGEGPGDSEDVLGKPFKGPAGQLLDSIIRGARIPEGSYALTNLIGCVPRGEFDRKIHEPPEESIKACAPRLVDIVEICQPKLIVWVGDHSAKNGPNTLKNYINYSKCATVHILHPSAILQIAVSSQSLAKQRTIVELADAYEELG